jgi:hypothetical protein
LITKESEGENAEVRLHECTIKNCGRLCGEENRTGTVTLIKVFVSDLQIA